MYVISWRYTSETSLLSNPKSNSCKKSVVIFNGTISGDSDVSFVLYQSCCLSASDLSSINYMNSCSPCIIPFSFHPGQLHSAPYSGRIMQASGGGDTTRLWCRRAHTGGQAERNTSAHRCTDTRRYLLLIDLTFSFFQGTPCGGRVMHTGGGGDVIRIWG